ncbi:MAG: SDR family oxidoreductase [Verrucomicrobia bacterium]|nr:SDR family oxidoreductase [Verrucomicrobiota bacterium]
MSDKTLPGKVAMITGGGRGLGKAIALALGGAGVKVALSSRTQAELDSTVAALRATGVDAEAFPADVTDEAAVGRLQRDVLARFGKVHILVNNAGINIRKPVQDFTLAEFRAVMDTTLISTFLMCRAFVPQMKPLGYGRIIGLASTMGHVSIAHRTPYSTAKAGIMGFTRALALELAPDGITVNTISPGPFATEMNMTILNNPELAQTFTSKIPLGRWGKVEEVGALAKFICSEGAAFMTGTDFLIDGGWCAQ